MARATKEAAEEAWRCDEWPRLREDVVDFSFDDADRTTTQGERRRGFRGAEATALLLPFGAIAAREGIKEALIVSVWSEGEEEAGTARTTEGERSVRSRVKNKKEESEDEGGRRERKGVHSF